MKKVFNNTILSAITAGLALSLTSGCGDVSLNNSVSSQFAKQSQMSSYSKVKNTWDFREESIYFVLTDRFVDGDKNNNNIYGDEYRPGNLFYNQGGDFKGLIENIDHIKDMGFTAIWVTPPVMQPPGRYMSADGGYEATGYHGYWAWDFSKIDQHLESPGYTYDDFIKVAHSKGLKVIQDIVANHAHGDSTNPAVKWHNDRGKVFGLGQMFDYLADTKSTWFHNPYAITTRNPLWFNHGGPKIADLIDFNENNPAVAEWLCNVYKQYQNKGVDAFRIDTVAWMNPQFWTKFTDEMHKNKPNFFMFGEVWTNGDYNWLSSYTKLGSLPGDAMSNGMSVLDMPGSAMSTWGQLERVFKGERYETVDKVLSHDNVYKDPTYLVSFLDNHDKPRFNGTGGDGMPASTESYIDALNWYFTTRGIPCIYYGTENQMQGGNDPDNRRVLGVEGIQQSKNSPVYRQLKKLNAVRKASVALQKGNQTKLFGSDNQYAFKKEYGNNIAVVALNKDGQNSTITLNNIPNGKYKELYTGTDIEVTNNTYSASLPGHSVRTFVQGEVKGEPWTVKDWGLKAASAKTTIKTTVLKTTVRR